MGDSLGTEGVKVVCVCVCVCVYTHAQAHIVEAGTRPVNVCVLSHVQLFETLWTVPH